MTPRQITSLLRLASGGNALSFQNRHMVREVICAKETKSARAPALAAVSQIHKLSALREASRARHFERQLTLAAADSAFGARCIGDPAFVRGQELKYTRFTRRCG
jgi:hypothetical protein